MKKLLSFSITIVLSIIMVGCMNDEMKLYGYDDKAIKAELNESELQPKIPTKLPFKNGFGEIIPPLNEAESKYMFQANFYSKEKGIQKHLMLMVFKGENVADRPSKSHENVNIDGIEGTLFENSAGTLILSWRDNEFHYKLAYFSAQLDAKMSKEQLIETAKSFK